METKDTLSSCSNSEEQQMQQIQDKAKKSCMVSFRKLHSHLKHLSHDNLKGTRIESGFKRAFATLFGQDVETFIGTMFLNVDQLEKQLDKEEFQEIGSTYSFKDKVIRETAVDASLDNTERHWDRIQRADTSSKQGMMHMQMSRYQTHIAHADDADIKPIYDEEPMAEVQLIADHNVFATGQQHTEQPEFNNEGEVDQNAE
ncbi:hypothetical protein Tco_0501705 [Tanacetum coccineum]